MLERIEKRVAADQSGYAGLVRVKEIIKSWEQVLLPPVTDTPIHEVRAFVEFAGFGGVIVGTKVGDFMSALSLLGFPSRQVREDDDVSIELGGAGAEDQNYSRIHGRDLPRSVLDKRRVEEVRNPERADSTEDRVITAQKWGDEIFDLLGASHQISGVNDQLWLQGLPKFLKDFSGIHPNVGVDHHDRPINGE